MHEMAAALACDGIVSHRSAGVMRELVPVQPGTLVDIAVDSARRVERSGVRIHRCILLPEDIGQIDGVPITTLARTIFDLAAVLTSRELERVLATEREDPDVRHQLRRLLERHSTRSGTRSLRELLRRDAPLLTRSEAEEKLLQLVRSAGLPEPETNVAVHGYEVDCFFQEARLIVEVDGYAWHRSRRAFHRDRERDAVLSAAGIQVVRLTWRQLAAHRGRTLAELAMAIARNTGGR